MSRYLHELPNGSFRECTSDEIVIAEYTKVERERLEVLIEEANKELKALTTGCKHPVCFDTAGFPYDIRKCVACGYTSLI